MGPEYRRTVAQLLAGLCLLTASAGNGVLQAWSPLLALLAVGGALLLATGTAGLLRQHHAAHPGAAHPGAHRPRRGRRPGV
jgi:hypothetical protein